MTDRRSRLGIRSMDWLDGITVRHPRKYQLGNLLACWQQRMHDRDLQGLTKPSGTDLRQGDNPVI